MFHKVLIPLDGSRWSEDVIDRIMPELEPGCEIILVGVETGTSEVAVSLGKRMSRERTTRILAHARRAGIRACGHFVLGVPGESPAATRATIEYARELPLDYASFNLYAARLGTPMRDDLVAAGRLQADDFGEQDVSAFANPYAAMSAAELRRLFRWAVLSFYLRPRQVGRLLRHTPWSTLARQGTGVLRLMVQAGA